MNFVVKIQHYLFGLNVYMGIRIALDSMCAYYPIVGL